MSEPTRSAPETPSGKVKFTLLLDRPDWEDAEAAAIRLSVQAGASVTIQNYLRGAIAMRNRDVLSKEAA